jgi:enoyl-CoA hydratase
MAYTAIALEKKDHIATITLSRPRVLNAVDAQMAEELDDACRNIGQDEDIRAAIITGAGDRAFCAGGDLAQTSESPTSPVEAFPQIFEVGNMLAAVDRPVVAAINGYALGLGLCLAMASDIRIAAENALLGVPDLARGHLPLSGITQRLARLVGRGAALEMLLTAEPIDAREAYRLGLVSKVVPPAKLMPEAQALAQKIASKGPIALRFAKEAVGKGMDLTLDQGLRLEADLYFLLHTTQDRTEGVKAFQEKRTPTFKGK